jgi:hypothetical protein
LVVTGGTAVDTLTAAANDVTLVGGEGNDILTVNSGADRAVLTGGDGDDTFVIAGPSSTDSVYAKVTDFSAGDKIQFAGATKFVSAEVTLSEGATESTQALMDLAANNLGVGEMGWFETGGNTFIVMDATPDSTDGFNGNEDIVLMLTGVHDLSNASFNSDIGSIVSQLEMA